MPPTAKLAEPTLHLLDVDSHPTDRIIAGHVQHQLHEQTGYVSEKLADTLLLGAEHLKCLGFHPDPAADCTTPDVPACVPNLLQ